jgi:DNA-binding transcriptional LysR family regulator
MAGPVGLILRVTSASTYPASGLYATYLWLTYVGAAFLKGVRVALAEVRRSVTLAQAAARGELGRFRIAFTHTSAYVDAIPDIVRRFAKRHANVVLKLLHLDWSELAAALRNGRIDAAFCTHLPAEPELKSELLFEERLFLAVPRRHRLAKQEAVRLSQLRDERFIMTPPRDLPYCFRDFRAEILAHGYWLNEAIEASGQATQLSFVAAGMGVCFLAWRKRGATEHAVVFKPVPELNFRIQNVLLWTEEEGPSPLVTSLREISRELRPSLCDECGKAPVRRSCRARR